MGSWFEDETVGVEKRYMILIICHPARHMLGDSLPPPPIGKRSVESPALSTPPPRAAWATVCLQGYMGTARTKHLAGDLYAVRHGWGGLLPDVGESIVLITQLRSRTELN